MPFSQKPIVCINGSRTINDINLDLYLNPAEIGCIVSGGANGADTLAEKWAKRHKIEFVAFLANWDKYGKSAGIKRNIDMINFCDKLVSFWDKKSRGTLHAIEYCQKINRPYEIHIIESLD